MTVVTTFHERVYISWLLVTATTCRTWVAYVAAALRCVDKWKERVCVHSAKPLRKAWRWHGIRSHPQKLVPDSPETRAAEAADMFKGQLREPWRSVAPHVFVANRSCSSPLYIFQLCS